MGGIEFCEDCPIEVFTGQQIYCGKCSVKAVNKLLKAIQIAFRDAKEN